MHRIDTDTRSVDKHGTGKDGFVEVSQVSGVAPTQVTAEWMDALQEEILSVIEAASFLSDALTPTKYTNDQFSKALSAHSRPLLQVSNWEEQAVDTFVGTIWGIAFGDTGEVVTVGSSVDIQRSTNGGHTWNQETAASASGTLTGAVWNGSLWCVVGGTGAGTTLIETSPDGTTWTSRTPGAPYTGDLQWVAWNGTVFCAVGTAGGVQTSPDGITWTDRTPAGAYAGLIYAVAWNGTNFVFVGSGTGSDNIQSSPDGITWTSRLSDSETRRGIAYGNGMFYTLSDAGEAYTSTDDGVTWVNAGSHTIGNSERIAFANGIFISNDPSTESFNITRDGTRLSNIVLQSGGLNPRAIATDGTIWIASAQSGNVYKSLRIAV